MLDVTDGTAMCPIAYRNLLPAISQIDSCEVLRVTCNLPHRLSVSLRPGSKHTRCGCASPRSADGWFRACGQALSSTTVSNANVSLISEKGKTFPVGFEIPPWDLF
jgi:hypothetical protein